MLAAEPWNGGMERAMAADAARRGTTLSRAIWVAAASFALLFASLAGLESPDATAQQAGGWSTDLDIKAKPAAPGGERQPARPQPDGSFGTTVLKKKSAEPQILAGMSKVRLVALLTADGQRIEQDLVWRVFEQSSDTQSAGRRISTHAEASPLLAVSSAS